MKLADGKNALLVSMVEARSAARAILMFTSIVYHWASEVFGGGSRTIILMGCDDFCQRAGGAGGEAGGEVSQTQLLSTMRSFTSQCLVPRLPDAQCMAEAVEDCVKKKLADSACCARAASYCTAWSRGPGLPHSSILCHVARDNPDSFALVKEIPLKESLEAPRRIRLAKNLRGAYVVQPRLIVNLLGKLEEVEWLVQVGCSGAKGVSLSPRPFLYKLFYSPINGCQILSTALQSPGRGTSECRNNHPLGGQSWPMGDGTIIGSSVNLCSGG
ncbi:hypothetical protein Tco_0967544 [Tanacetum coccineum]